MRTMLAGALVMLLTGTAMADFTMKSTSCKFIGMAPGKTTEPMVKPGNGFTASCDRKGTDVTCTMGYGDGAKDAYSGKKNPAIPFVMAPRDGDVGSIMISDDHLNFVLFDAAKRSFAWAQTFVDSANGLIMQKSCIGEYQQTKK